MVDSTLILNQLCENISLVDYDKFVKCLGLFRISIIHLRTNEGCNSEI